MAKKPKPKGLKQLLCLFIRCSQKKGLLKRDPDNLTKPRLQLWDKKKLLHEEAIDHALEHGLVSSSWTFHGVIYSKLCRVELNDGHTRDDLAAFFSMIDPCPIWDAFVAAEAKGIVKITSHDN